MGKAKKGPKDARPLSVAWWIALLVGTAATILAAAVPEFYKDVKAWALPGDVFGSYLLLSPDDDAPGAVHVSALTMKSHGYQLWGEESAGRKSWVYSGYINAGYLLFSYRSKDDLGIGFGEYFLEPKDGEKAEYVGHMIGNFCDSKGQQPARRIMRCNVVMVRGEPGGTEERRAREFYKEYLQKPCVLLKEARRVPIEQCTGSVK